MSNGNAHRRRPFLISIQPFCRVTVTVRIMVWVRFRAAKPRKLLGYAVLGLPYDVTDTVSLSVRPGQAWPWWHESWLISHVMTEVIEEWAKIPVFINWQWLWICFRRLDKLPCFYASGELLRHRLSPEELLQFVQRPKRKIRGSEPRPVRRRDKMLRKYTNFPMLFINPLRPILPAVTPLALLALWFAFPAVTPQHSYDASPTNGKALSAPLASAGRPCTRSFISRILNSW